MTGLIVLGICCAGLKVAKQFSGKNALKPWSQKLLRAKTDHSLQKKATEETTVAADNGVQVLPASPEHYLAVSTAVLFLLPLQGIVPFTTLLTLVALSYIYFPILERAVECVKKKKIGNDVINILILFSGIAVGEYLPVVMLAILYYFSRRILNKTRNHSKNKLVNILDQELRSAWVMADGTAVEIPLEAVRINDLVVVHTGEVIPVDGIIVEGKAIVDQHVLTGESQPEEKESGDQVFASTMMIAGKIVIRALKTGQDTAVAKIGEVLNASINFKTEVQSKGEEWANKSALPLLVLSTMTNLILGPGRALVVLNSKFGNRIEALAPLGTLNYISIASHNGILIKDGQAIELLRNVDTIVFDKTGTLTEEQPVVSRIICCGTYDEKTVLTCAAAAELKLSHPVARAIVAKAQETQLELPDVEDSNYTVGYGISADIDGKKIRVGSYRFMINEGFTIPEDIETAKNNADLAAHSLVLVAINEEICGAVEMQASTRPEIHSTLQDLRNSGIKHFSIISGDRQQPTRKLADELGMDSCYYDVLPENKADIVKQLQAEGKSVCFIGDGINDTIAMKAADVSISLQGASAIATDVAEIILLDGTLNKLGHLFSLSRELDTNLSNGFMITISSVFINLIGAWFLHFTLLTAIIVNFMSFLVGLLNAMVPLKQLKDTQASPNP